MYSMRVATAKPPFANICDIMGLDRFALLGKKRKYPVEPVLHCSQPEKSGTIGTEFCTINSNKLKLFDNKAGSGKVMEPCGRNRQEGTWKQNR